MSFLRKSLSEDSVDRYSHTWAFLFLILLAIVTLFIPLSPYLAVGNSGPTTGQLRTSSSSAPLSSPSSEKNSQRSPPRYTASCWLPSQFTFSMTAYSNAVCGQTLNFLVRGKPVSGAAELFALNLRETPTPIDGAKPLTVDDFRHLWESGSKTAAANETGKGETDEDQKEKEDEERRARMEILRNKREGLEFRIREFISYKTPLFLFILALCLRLPHVLWSFLSLCCGGANLDQTLVSLQAGLMNVSGRGDKIRKDISTAFGKPSKKTGLLYLLMKLFMVVVVCVGMVVVSRTYLTEINSLDNDLQDVNMMDVNMMDSPLSQQPSRQKVDVIDNAADQSQASSDMESIVYICAFSIRQLQNMQNFAVQCAFLPHTNSGGNDDASGGGGQDRNIMAENENHAHRAMSEKDILLLYQALHTLVLALLVFLTVFNIASFVAWLFKLLVPSCSRGMGLGSKASVDLVFAVAMALNNAGALVAMEMANTASGRSDGESYGGAGSGAVEESYKLKDAEDQS